MKKIFITLLGALFLAAASYAQNANPSPDLLKDKANFINTDLFESEIVFANPQINAEVVAAYEANPASYKDEELLPVAVCYMTLRNGAKTRELLEKFMISRPENLRAIRTYATMLLLSDNKDNLPKAFEYYKKAVAKGDKEALKSLVSAYIITNSIDEIAAYIDQLKPLAKDDLATANMIFMYAFRKAAPSADKKSMVLPEADAALVKGVIGAFDLDAVLNAATAESLTAALRFYVSEKSLWTPQSLIIPGRAANLAGAWSLARDIFGQILAADPKNTKALRGKAVVEYNIGGVEDASALIMQALKLGEKEAVNDAMELNILSKGKVNSGGKYNAYFAEADFTPQVRLNMLSYSLTHDNQADMFFMALNGKTADMILAEPQLGSVIRDGIKKYEGDMRAIELKKRFEDAQQAK